MIIDTQSPPRSAAAAPPANPPFSISTKLRQIRVYLRANAPFLYLGLAILLFFIIFFAPEMLVTIHSGQVGVRYLRFFGGTQVDRIVDEGFHFVFPWDKLYVYDVRVQEAKHRITVLTEEGLAVGLNLSIRYQPEAELVGLLHQRIGPEYRDRVVVPEVESGLRNVVGKVVLKNLVELESPNVSERIRNITADKLDGSFVRLVGVIVVGIDLPSTVKSAIEDKMVQSEMANSYVFRLDRERKEAERRRIESIGLVEYNRRLAASITPALLRWRSIDAAKELSLSPNTKTIVLGGNGSGSMPFLLGGEK